MARCDDCGAPFCERCGQEYESGTGCPDRALAFVRPDGAVQWRERIVCAGPRDFYADGFKDGVPRRCSDCGTAEEELHHLGCSKETCPGCGGQLFACDDCDWRSPREIEMAP